MAAIHKGSDIKSGPGHIIATNGVGLIHSLDCPSCPYGILDPIDKTINCDEFTCNECKRLYTRTDLAKKNILLN